MAHCYIHESEHFSCLIKRTFLFTRWTSTQGLPKLSNLVFIRHSYNTLPFKFQRSQWKTGRQKYYKTQRQQIISREQFYPPYITGQMQILAHSDCKRMFKVFSSSIPEMSQYRVDTQSHHQLKSYWNLRATGRRSISFI